MRYKRRNKGRYRKHGAAPVQYAPHTMDARSRKLYARAPKAIKQRYKKFWKIAGPPSVKTLPGNLPGLKGTNWLVGLGYTKVALLSSGDKGVKGSKKRKVHGRWHVTTDGKGKQIFLLSGNPVSGPLKQVGYAHETHYIPSADIEKAGTHKAGTYWRHIHGVDDEKRGVPKSKLKYPPVFADRNGKVDAKSNFFYGKTPLGKVTDWMYY